MSLRITLASVALLISAAHSGHAQSYPSRAITLVVPFPAGGGNDALARLVAERMSKTLGQQVVVENRGGAGGTIATRAIAKGAAGDECPFHRLEDEPGEKPTYRVDAWHIGAAGEVQSREQKIHR